MKHLLTTFGIIALFCMIKPQYASAQRGGEHGTPPPDPNNVHLFNRTLNTSGYGGIPVGEILFYDTEGPSIGSPFLTEGISTNEIANIDLFNLDSHFPGFGGQYNDRAASVAFTGDCVGLYTFYDSPESDVSDDYTTIYVKVPLPTGKSYYVWDLDHSYTDDYVEIVNHHANGLLSGTVSMVHVHKDQTL